MGTASYVNNRLYRTAGARENGLEYTKPRTDPYSGAHNSNDFRPTEWEIAFHPYRLGGIGHVQHGESAFADGHIGIVIY